MAKGEKYCKNGHRVGPRSFNCGVCGAGFTVKGKVYEDVDPAARQQVIKDTTQGMDRDEKHRLFKLVKKCKDVCEAGILAKYYGVKSKSWESVCGKYRIRFTPVFMGVDLSSGDGKTYRLISNNHGSWEPVKPKSRFKSLFGAIRYMEKVVSGKPLVKEAPSRKMRLRSRKAVGK